MGRTEDRVAPEIGEGAGGKAAVLVAVCGVTKCLRLCHQQKEGLVMTATR